MVDLRCCETGVMADESLSSRLSGSMLMWNSPHWPSYLCSDKCMRSKGGRLNWVCFTDSNICCETQRWNRHTIVLLPTTLCNIYEPVKGGESVLRYENILTMCSSFTVMQLTYGVVGWKVFAPQLWGLDFEKLKAFSYVLPKKDLELWQRIRTKVVLKIAWHHIL